MVETQSLPGFRQPLPYTGEGKGGPSPYEEVVVFQTTLPLLLNTYIPYSTITLTQDSTNLWIYILYIR